MILLIKGAIVFSNGKSSMSVPMVNIGKVRVFVNNAAVIVWMIVRLAAIPPKIMRMLVVFVMRMTVGMC